MNKFNSTASARFQCFTSFVFINSIKVWIHAWSDCSFLSFIWGWYYIFCLKGQLTYFEPFPGVMEFLTQFQCHFCIERNSINLFECCLFWQQNAAWQYLLSLKILWGVCDAFSFCKRWPPEKRFQWLCTIWSNFSSK